MKDASVNKLLDQIVQLNRELTPTDLAQASRLFQKLEFEANEVLLQAGQVCRHLYFLDEGLIRCHAFADDRTLWCEFENTFFMSPRSFFQEVPSREILTFLEPSRVYAIHYHDLNELYRTNPRWAVWGIRFMEREYQKLESIYQLLFYKDASARYEELLEARPDVTQRIPLHYIASFLGVSPISLSRIRAGKQKKRF
jgi:CRP/FNR family transcriptional regulator, anaerobic regulatory protein